MKNLITLFLLSFSISSFSQEINRENVNGKIIVEGSDIEGITIYNSSSSKGAITDKNGEFTIAVQLNDVIEVRAIEYQNFNFKVNKFITKSKLMSIFLIEEINKLDEVLLTNKKLSGNIETDLSNVITFSPKLNVIYFGSNKEQLKNIESTSLLNTEINTTHSQAQTMVNGLNIVNVVDQLLIPLFRSEVKDKKAAGITEVPAKSIKYYLGSNFLVENFNIPEYRVEEFIRYVEDDTFDFDLLNYGHELEFLEILSKRSKTFLESKKSTD